MYCVKVLIFAEKKQDVDAIHEYLLLKSIEAVSIHGGKGLSLILFLEDIRCMYYKQHLNSLEVWKCCITYVLPILYCIFSTFIFESS